MAMNSKEAQAYLINPLTEPEPSAVTGPGTRFIPDARSEASFHGSSSGSAAPRRSQSTRLQKTRPASNSVSSRQYPTPPQSASPRRSEFPPTNPFSDKSSSNRGLSPRPSGEFLSVGDAHTTGRRRGSSLGERFPGDKSHEPLNMLRSHSKRANRAPHLRQKNQIGADKIDVLDTTGFMYHHEGPYDATYASRNRVFKYAPVEAVAGSNEEALKATPREKIQDSIDKHVPLDGVAYVPSGEQDREGNVYEYQEGENMMTEFGGNYKRLPGYEYHPDDIKGKSEPAYSQDKQLREHKAHRNDMEMSATANRNRAASNVSQGYSGNDVGLAPHAEGTGRERSGSKSLGEGLKKRFGSLRKKSRD